VTFWQSKNYADAANSGMHAHLKPIGLELHLFVYTRYISGSGQFGHFVGQIGQKNGHTTGWLLDVVMHYPISKAIKINMRLKSF
jgi:hypothetical protein